MTAFCSYSVLVVAMVAGDITGYNKHACRRNNEESDVIYSFIVHSLSTCVVL